MPVLSKLQNKFRLQSLPNQSGKFHGQLPRDVELSPLRLVLLPTALMAALLHLAKEKHPFVMDRMESVKTCARMGIQKWLKRLNAAD